MHLIDKIIIGTYITLIFIIGILMRKRVSNFSEFMLAGQGLGLSLGVTSMLGTELGLITVMNFSELGVLQFFSSFHIGLFGFIVTLTVGVSGFVVSELREMNVKSIPEFYGKRFDSRVRLIGAILLVLGGVLNMGIFLKIGAQFIQSIFNFPSDTDTLKIIMIILLIIVLTYTIMGGMLSVILTDYFQFVILSFGLIYVTIYSIYFLGWNNIFESIEVFANNQEKSPYNPFITKGGSYVVWQLILAFVSAVVWPTAITRALSMKDSKTVKKQYMWSSISFLVRFMIPCFIGICALVYFDGIIINSEETLMPEYLRDILPIGFLGLVTAGMISAFMSTHDSYLLCWSTIITNDIIDPLTNYNLTSRSKINISRIIILILGIYILLWGLFYDGGDAIWDYLGVTGAIYFSGAITVLIAGIYWEKASEIGAILALLGGLSALLGLEPIRILLFPNLTGSQIGLISVLVTIIMMIVGSVLFPSKRKI